MKKALNIVSWILFGLFATGMLWIPTLILFGGF